MKTEPKQKKTTVATKSRKDGKTKGRNAYEAAAYVLNGGDLAEKRGPDFRKEETLFFILHVLMSLPDGIVARLCPQHISYMWLTINDRWWGYEGLRMFPLPRVFDEWMWGHPEKLKAPTTPLIRQRTVKEHKRLLKQRWNEVSAIPMRNVQRQLFEAMGAGEYPYEAVTQGSPVPDCREVLLPDAVAAAAMRFLPVFLPSWDASESNWSTKLGFRTLAG